MTQFRVVPTSPRNEIPAGWRAAVWRRRWHDVRPLATCLAQGAIAGLLAVLVLVCT